MIIPLLTWHFISCSLCVWLATPDSTLFFPQFSVWLSHLTLSCPVIGQYALYYSNHSNKSSQCTKGLFHSNRLLKGCSVPRACESLQVYLSSCTRASQQYKSNGEILLWFYHLNFVSVLFSLSFDLLTVLFLLKISLRKSII